MAKADNQPKSVSVSLRFSETEYAELNKALKERIALKIQRIPKLSLLRIFVG